MPAPQPAIPARVAQTTGRLEPGVLQPILLFALGWLGIWITIAVLNPALHHILPVQLVGAAVMIACLVLNRSGHTRAATIVFCCGMLVLLQVPPFLNGRVEIPAILLPPLLVLGAGLMWNTRAAIIMAAATSLSWLVVLLAIEQGLVATAAPLQPGLHFWLILTAVLGVICAGLVMTTRTLQRTLRDSEGSSAEVRKAPSDDGPAAELGSGPRAGDPTLRGSGAAGPHLEDLELVGQLAGGIAHDFNNLLTVVGSASELIEDDPDATGSILELAGQIRRAQERAAIITRRLLAFAQQQIVETRRLAVGPIVNSQAQALLQFGGPGITIDLSVTTDDTTVLSSDTEIEQILFNLVTNARDAIDGVGPISVRVGRRRLAEACDGPAGVVPPGEYVVVSVEDGGRGISADGLSRVFEPFYTTHGLSSGRGLGLPAVLGIVRRAAGQVLIESTKGSGTLVEVLLPLSTPPALPRPNPASS